MPKRIKCQLIRFLEVVNRSPFILVTKSSSACQSKDTQYLCPPKYSMNKTLVGATPMDFHRQLPKTSLLGYCKPANRGISITVLVSFSTEIKLLNVF